MLPVSSHGTAYKGIRVGRTRESASWRSTQNALQTHLLERISGHGQNAILEVEGREGWLRVCAAHSRAEGPR